jgi:serine/threonine protein kinase
MHAPQDLVAQRYRLISELGRGGMGVTWEAEDERLDRRVALKTIIPKLARDAKKLARFEQGAKAVARLRSPHIVQLLDYGVDKTPFMVMELLEGTVLQQRLESSGPLELDAAVRVVAQTAKALTVAHEAGIIHRNLKPANIFLVRDADDDFVKVFDFGTAKWLTGFRNANDLTTMGSIMGSPEYVAPEQINGEERSDHRADVWSLAAIAYRIITGIGPFEGEQIGVTIRHILFNKPPAPSAVNPALPSELDAFFETALAKERGQRFQSARDLSDSLCQALGMSGTLLLGPRGSVEHPPPIDDGVVEDAMIEEYAAPGRGDGESPRADGPPSEAQPVEAQPVEAEDVAATSTASPSTRLLVTTSPLVRPVMKRRRSRLNLPAPGVLIAGALVAVVLGGALAFWLYRPPAPHKDVAPSARASTEAPRSAPRPPPAVQEANGTPSATPPPSSSAPGNGARAQPRPRPAPPVDIYD